MNGGRVGSVQRRPRTNRRAVRARALTGLAALLVLLALTLPGRLEDLTPTAFLRLPLEALVLLAIVVALPPRLSRVRAAIAVAAGLVLALVAVLRLLDIGFLQALNRPFDPVIDWHYAGSLVETARSSVGNGLGTVLLVAAALVALALLVVVPLAVLRVAGVAARHRRRAAQALALLAALWLVLAAVGVKGPAGPVAARNTAGYAYAEVSRIPGELRDQREFEVQAEEDPYRSAAADELLAGLRGKDVLFVFVESLGRVAVDGSSSFSREVNTVLDEGTRDLEAARFSTRSAFMRSPTFGALSWLAHATLQSGLWVDSQQRYDVLMTSPRLTLTHLFRRAGWRTVGTVPANTRDWPQGDYYGFDQFYDSRNVGYQGPRFGYPPVPDQYTLSAFHRLELAPEGRRPVMAEIDLITSHAPWSRTPRMVDWATVGDGSVFDGMVEQLPSERDIWTSPERIRDAYGESIEYSMRALVDFIRLYGDDDLVVVLLGDHQPATVVSGEDAGRDVPVAVVARDPAVVDRFEDWGWGEGLRPRPDAPVMPMDAFRDRFLTAFAANGHSGALTAGAR